MLLHCVTSQAAYGLYLLSHTTHRPSPARLYQFHTYELFYNELYIRRSI